MNPLEALAFSVIMATVQQTVKNPKLKTEVQNQLTGLATLIINEYGGTVTMPATSPTAV